MIHAKGRKKKKIIGIAKHTKMENTEVIQKFTAYYADPEMQERMIPFMKDRECMVVSKEKTDYPVMRYLKIDKIEYIPFKINYFMRTNNVPYNVYATLNHFRNGMLLMRTREEKDKFCDTFFKFLDGSDLGFDLDCDSDDSIHFPQKDALYLVKALEKMEMSPEVRFSGMGFQVVVRYENLISDWKRLSFDPTIKDSFFEITSTWQRSFKNKCKTLDLKTIEPRRVFKVPYSLVFNRSKSEKIYVCAPLSMDQLKNFKIGEYLYNG